MKVRPAALIVRDGAILTMRYRYGSGLVYVLPGGNPDSGESLPETIARELQEELNVEVSVGSLVLAGEVLGFQGREDTLHCVFSAQLTSDAPRINPEQTTAEAVEWLPLERIPEVTLYPNFGPHLGAISETFLYTGPLQQNYKS